MEKQYMTSQEAAVYLGYKNSTLENYRSENYGPRYFRRGNRIIYYRADLDEWMLNRKYKWRSADIAGMEVKFLDGREEEFAEVISEEDVRALKAANQLIVDAMTAQKHDHGKPRMDLLPPTALVEIGKVLAFGAQKYGDHNWRHGLAYSRLHAAAMRHITAFTAGEDLDPESGLPHLAHAACCLMMLIDTASDRPDLDDRWRPKRDDRR